jgi:hypothetical protein
MTQFEVHGPYDIPVYKGAAGRVITDDDVRNFWKSHPALGNNVGCYIFAIRAGKGYTPIYIGKAAKTFKQEAFSSHKLSKYQQAMVDYVRGTPVIFFVAHPVKKGMNNNSHIKQLEEFLIQTAIAVNPDLMNIKGTKREKWGIKGILRSNPGKPNNTAKELKRALNIKAT